jgi:MYXO-CTERM domain-containing protein
MISILQHPAQRDFLLAGLSFGAAISTDGGAHWSWVCEDALGGNGSVDPVLALLPDGDMLYMSGEHGVYRSSDGGCAWASLPGTGEETPQGLAPHPTDPNTWYVVTQDALRGAVWVTRNRGASIAPLWAAPTGLYLNDIAVTPADPNRIVATGTSSAFEPRVARSQDGGATWASGPLPGAPTSAYVVLAGISPVDPNTVLFLVQDTTANLHVLRSADGGQSATDVLSNEGLTRGLAFSADGAQAWVAAQDRIYHSLDGGRTFAPLARPQENACVTYADATTLYACGGITDGFALAKSADGGSTWTPLFRLPELGGPERCAPGTPVAETCGPLWPAEQAKLQALVVTTQDANTPTPGPAPPRAGCSCQGSPDGLLPLLGAALLARRLRRLRRQ